MLAIVPPTILATNTFPISGTTTANGTPLIQIQYSDSMEIATAGNANNYLLLGASGDIIPIVSVTPTSPGGLPANSVFQLTYNTGNAGNQMIVDNYTLFVKGSNVYEATHTLAMANPGQLIVANGGSAKNIAVASLAGNGTVGTESQYALPTSGFSPRPWAVATADLDRDGISDLVIVGAGTNQVSIFTGRSAAEGGGYDLSPSIILDLPTGATNQPEFVTLADFNSDGFIDIAVASANVSQISVFMNTATSAGAMSFGGATSFNADLVAVSPMVGLVSGDFNGDGNVDLAVALGTATTDLGIDAILDYRINFFSGLGTGLFSSIPFSLKVGDVGDPAVPTPPSGIQPSALAAGFITNTLRPDLILGGTSTGAGLKVYKNNLLGGFSFTAQPLLSASSVVSISTGVMNAGGLQGIVATTTGGATNVETYFYTANGVSSAGPTYNVTGANTGQVIIGDVNNDGRGDLVFTNGSAAGKATVYFNGYVGGAINGVSYATATAPTIITSVGHGLVAGQEITISGAGSPELVNGTWKVTPLTGGIVTSAGSPVTAGINGDGTNPITVTTSSAHNLKSGTKVKITGSTTFPAAVGTFTITVVDATHFTLSGTIGVVGSDTSGLATWASLDMFSLSSPTIASAVASGSTDVAITAVNPTNLATGDSVRISGLGGALSTAGLNGNAYVVTVTGANTFTLNGTNTVPAATDNSGNWSFLSHGITSANWPNGSSLITLTVPVPANPITMGVLTGDKFTITNMTGALASTLNGNTYTVSSRTATTITFNFGSTNSSGSAIAGTGGNWVQVANGAETWALTATGVGAVGTGTSNVVITTATTQGLVTGESVKITNMPGFASINNNTYFITVIDGTHFSLNLTNTVPFTGSAIAGAWTVVPTFFQASGSPYTVDGTPKGVALADTDQDGNLDIITANNTGNDFSTLLGKGDGTFQTTKNTTLSNTPGGVVMADLNGDGISDMVVLNNNGSTSSKVTVLQGQLGGTYLAPVDISVGTGLRNLVSVAVGKVKTNSTGLPDIVFVDNNNADNYVGLLFNNISTAGSTITTSSFLPAASPITTASSSSPNKVALADFNGDGKMDMVVSLKGSGGFGSTKGNLVYLGNASGNGTFQTLPITDSGKSMSDVVTGDFNNDGKADFVSLDSTGGFGVNKIYAHYGDGKGGFSVATKVSTVITNSTSLAAADFNNDGFLDIVVSSAESFSTTTGGISILLNQLGSGFGSATQTLVIPGKRLQAVLTTDLNQDGYADVVVSTQNNPTGNDNVYVLIGNGDGTVNAPVPYQLGGVVTTLPPSYLAATPSPLIPITTFTSSGNLVRTNLVANGNFEARDLNGTVGSLQSWQTYNMPAPNSGSFGSWLPQTGTISTLSATAVPSPSNAYRALLDQTNQIPYTPPSFNPNSDASYQGSHAIYQDIYIPAGAISATLSLTLYADNSEAAGSVVTNIGANGWSDPAGTTSKYTLDFRASEGNQQVRVDILDPTITPGATVDPVLGGITYVPYGTATASATAGVVTLTTASTAALTGGQSVLISGMTGALAVLNGNSYVLTVASATTFTITPGGGLNGTDSGAWTLANPTGDGVLRTEFITSQASAKTFTINIKDNDLTAYAGRTIRLRIASANNAGRLILGVDNVVLKAKFNDSVKPTLTRVTVQSPAFYQFSGNAAANVLSSGADVTITTASTVGLGVGNVVQINGLSGPLSSVLNGNTYSISNVTGSTFTLDLTAGQAAGANATGGSWSSLPHTNDPTILGTAGDSSGLAGISYVAIDPTGTSFTGSSVLKITPSQLDSSGNFSIKLPTVNPGLNTIGVAVVDKAGNMTKQSFQFFMQTNSVTEWQALGPQGIDVSTQPNVNYSTVSGRITSVIPDLSDLSGNSYFVGTPNGGIWKTTNNGSSWVPTTNGVTDGSGNPIPVSVGSIAQTQLSGYITSIVGSGSTDVVVTTTAHAGLATGDKVTLQGVTGTTGVGNGPFGAAINNTFTITMTGANTFTLNNTASAAFIGTDITLKGRWADLNKYVLYAGTGVGDQGLDSRPGVGVLRSIDGGVTWTLIGDSSTQLLDARIVKIVVDKNDSNIAYAGDAGDQTLGRTSGGVYKTTDGGLTWINVLTPTAMGLGAGTQLASVTDLVIDPFDSTTLLVGLGNIGRVANSATAGVYKSALNSGSTWTSVVGGNNPAVPNNTLPSGLGVGRVTIGWAGGQAANEKIIYFTIATPPGFNTPPFVDWGQFSGLYKTSDYLLNFTKVMLKVRNNSTPLGSPIFNNINLFGQDGANVGSIVVDPNNPNALYIGGSSRWTGGGFTSHSLVYVDTGNMRDTTYTYTDVLTSTTVLPNDGDDKTKAKKGYTAQGGVGFYNVAASDGPYTGEGVYWYDLNTARSGGTGTLNLLPPAITSLGIDSFGRLLVGTSGGIWRGTNNGMGYDFDSGGSGILSSGFGNSFTTAGMSFASLNGNLQIADMTSVALDQNNPGVYYATQYDTGVSGSTNALEWTSQGLTGPTIPTFGNLNIPTAWSVNASSPPPGSPLGTPITLFRLWQYADSKALIPETSNDGGTTWTATASAGISASLTGGIFPGFAVNPTPVFNSGLWQTQLLFGTNVVYLSNTSGAVWNQVGPNPLTTGTISAMSFAPSTSGVLFVGTTKGELFYSSNSGGTFTNTAGGGLPALKPINGIAVDPNNPNEAFAMLGGSFAGAHVYKTTNAGAGIPPGSGAAWTAVAGPWGNVQTYAMVIERSPNLAASGGKVYLATEVGVYYSTDDGATWNILGSGMPRVPVVSLSYSPILQTLAAATLGHGVLTINTAAISVIAPQTIEQDVTSLTSPVIPFTVNDTGLPPGSYTLTATSSNSALIPSDTAHVVLGGSGANRTIQLIPALHANSTLNGTAIITLKIVDSTNHTFTQTFTVTVSAINYAPTINNSTALTGVIAKQSTAQGSPFQVNFTVGDVEDAAGGLIVTATSSNQVLVPNVNLTPSGLGSANRTLNIQPAAGTGNATASNGGTGGTQVTITTASTAGMVNGQSVRFVGLSSGGSPNALTNALNYSANGNVSFIISNVTPTTFNVTTASLTAFTANDLGGSWTIDNNYGNTTITVNVTDSKGATTSTSFDLLVTTNAVLPASDNFTRATSPFLGPQWTEKVGSFSTNGTAGTGVASSSLSIATLNGVSTANIALQTDVSLPALTGVHVVGLVARYQGTGDVNMYLGAIHADGSGQMNAVIYRNLNNTNPTGTWTLLASQSLGAATTATQTLRFEAFNDSLKLFVNGSLKAWANDTALPGTGTSMVGFRATLGSVYDNFAASAIGQINPSLASTYTDAYPPSSTTGVASASGPGGAASVVITTSSTAGLVAGQTVVITNLTGTLATSLNNKTFTIANVLSGSFTLVGTTGLTGSGASGTWTLISQLSRNWTEHLGNFSVLKNSLLTNSSFAVATLNGVSQADVVVTDSVTLAASQAAGLVARYSGPGESNMYWAGLVRNATGTGGFAYLYRNINGAWTQLAIGSVADVSGLQALRFEVINDSLKFFVNGVWLLSANDSMLTTGSVGLRSTAGAVWSGAPTFSAGLHTPLLTPSISPTFTENFSTLLNPDHANQLNLNWRENLGNFTVASGALTTNAGFSVATLNGVSQADVVVTDSVTLAANQAAGLVARYSGPGDSNMYLAWLSRDATGTGGMAYLYRNFNGIWTALGSTNIADVSGPQALRFEVINDSLKFFVNGVWLLSANDSSLTTGSVGLRSTLGAVWSGSPNFTAGLHAALLTPTLTFNENFSTVTNPDHANQLNLNWRENVGNFTVDTSLHTLTTNTAFAVATVNGVSQADVVVSDSVTLAASQSAGLVARYSGPGDSNMYLAGLSRNATGTGGMAYLYRNFNGTWTPLGSTSIADVSGLQVLRFEVIATSLSLFVNNTLRVFTNDSMLTTGSVGVRSHKGAVWSDLSNNFTAAVLTGPVSLAGPGFVEPFNNTGTFNTNWRQNVGTFALSTSSQTLTTTSTPLGVATLYGVSQADVVVADSATIASGQSAGLVARYSGPGDSNMYCAGVSNSGGVFTAYIYRNVAGNWTLLSQKTLTGIPPTGDKDLRFEVINDSLKFFVNGALATAVNDSMLTTGTVGLRSTQGVIWKGSPSSFTAVVHPPLTPAGAFTFTEDFGTAYSTDQLNLTWRENVGAFTVATGAKTLTTSTGLAVATLNGVSQPDVVVSDGVTLAAGQYGGLVARYTGSGDKNMYLGMLYNAGTVGPVTGYFAYIYRNVNGTWTELANKSLGSLGTGVQKLRFEVINDSLKLFVNDILATAANDTMLTTGSVGLRSTQGAIWTGNTNSFIASVHPPLTSAGALPLTEDFTTAYSTNQLNLTWRENVGAFVVNTTTGTQSLTTSTGLAVATLNGVSELDVVVSDSVTIPIGQYAGLVARYAGSGDKNMYLGMLYNAGTVGPVTGYFAYIYRNVNGTWTELGNKSLGTLPAGAQALRFEVIGDSMKLFVNNTVTAFAYDSMLAAAGSVGLRSTQGVVWNGVGPNSFNVVVRMPLAPPSAPLSFTDGFSTSNYNGATNTVTTTGNELGLAWKEMIGAYSVGSSAATGTGNLNLAVVNTVQTDFMLSANVTVASGQYFGLAARYSGTGDNNMYWGAVGNVGGNYTAYIYKNVGGTWSLLASQSLISFTSLIAFSVVGTNLMLDLDGVSYAALTITDTSISSGKAGIRSIGNAAIMDFTAN